MLSEKAAQYILNSFLNSENKFIPGRIKEKGYFYLRQNFLKYYDPIVNYIFYNKKLLLPFSHDLPITKKMFPIYGDNLGRIASIIKTKYNNLTMLDVGANIGDSVIIVRDKINVPILCIEGEERYLNLLIKNLEDFDDIEFEKSFVGDKIFSKGKYIFSRGTGRIVEQENSKDLNLKSLKEIIPDHPKFKRSKLLKIDTDGFDCRIIRNEIEFLADAKPIIFFEYDPFLLNKLNDDGLSVFSVLANSGFNKLIFYTNTGEYLLSAQLNNNHTIRDIHYFFSGRNMESYTDICVFHSEDDDLAAEIKNSELNFFSSYRNFVIEK